MPARIQWIDIEALQQMVREELLSRGLLGVVHLCFPIRGEVAQGHPQIALQSVEVGHTQDGLLLPQSRMKAAQPGRVRGS